MDKYIIYINTNICDKCLKPISIITLPLVDFDFQSLYPHYMAAGKYKPNKYERRVENRRRLYEKLKKLGRRLKRHGKRRF